MSTILWALAYIAVGLGTLIVLWVIDPPRNWPTREPRRKPHSSATSASGIRPKVAIATPAGVSLPAPSEYTDGQLATIPGADWYIDGRRYREVSRTPTPNGYVIDIRPLDLPWSDDA